MPDDDWLDLLRQAVDTDPRGITGVAERIGYSRTTVSLVLSGNYAKPENVGRAVLAAYVRIDCPFLGISLATQECATYAARRYSAINAPDVPHWRACRKCPKNPNRQES